MRLQRGRTVRAWVGSGGAWFGGSTSRASVRNKYYINRRRLDICKTYLPVTSYQLPTDPRPLPGRPQHVQQPYIYYNAYAILQCARACAYYTGAGVRAYEGVGSRNIFAEKRHLTRPGDKSRLFYIIISARV